MKYITHNSQIDVRRPGQMRVVCSGRRVWSLNFQ
jgi:hypothetical protein